MTWGETEVQQPELILAGWNDKIIKQHHPIHTHKISERSPGSCLIPWNWLLPNPSPICLRHSDSSSPHQFKSFFSLCGGRGGGGGAIKISIFLILLLYGWSFQMIQSCCGPREKGTETRRRMPQQDLRIAINQFASFQKVWSWMGSRATWSGWGRGRESCDSVRAVATRFTTNTSSRSLFFPAYTGGNFPGLPWM